MRKERIYLDFNATAPLRPEVIQAVTQALTQQGNASSVHTEGRLAHKRIEDARRHVARLVGARDEDVIFTASGTEANTMALTPFVRVTRSCAAGACSVEAVKPVSRLFIGATEHPSIMAGGRFLSEQVERIPVDESGIVQVKWLTERLAQFAQEEPGARFLLSLQLANSETGIIQPVKEIAALVHEAGGIMHTDAVQAAGRVRIDIAELGVDLLTLSAHKLGGPQGVGALVLGGAGVDLGQALICGGGQERGRRSGTENVVGITGFGVAAELALQEISAYPEGLQSLRDRFEQHLLDQLPQIVILGQGSQRLGNTSAFMVPGLKAETMLMALDLAGVAVSSGSACSSGKVRRSHVLEAMEIAPELAEGALRVSFGWSSSESDFAFFVVALEKVIDMLISRQRSRSAA